MFAFILQRKDTLGTMLLSSGHVTQKLYFLYYVSFTHVDVISVEHANLSTKERIFGKLF